MLLDLYLEAMNVGLNNNIKKKKWQSTVLIIKS